MAFDKPTRNRLAKFVSDARRVIADEFTEQFQSLYGISAKGDIAPLDKLGHLDEVGTATAALLRERIEYLEKTHPDDKDGTRAAVSRLAREQAFTILNRLAAIRMAEMRGLIVESVGKGYQSKGFKVFETVAGSALGDTYHRYRRYLFCLFDELAIDLGVLFDRRSPQALLFPREPALLELLDLFHADDLERLWAEDETIGWIYQYYNDPEERKKMRAESAAPRNSRELAVRNQFFTPRYVVEFLTDNTLGRIWYEMTKGETRLAEQCRYLVRRPTEIFLVEGESAPVTPDQEGLTQEELLRQPVHIPHRQLKDPREIGMLDPACGSMHFGLYAFDLFETIYEESWDQGSCPAFLETYASKEDFIRDVPRLIIEHNIHGIDIDPRATQIAALSLWLRAQKAWQEQKVPAADRPRVRRSNIVCAEPMPGSPEMLEEFVATLNPPLLGELVKTVFDKMQLAGEAGSLLKIEEEIRTAIDTARKEWLKKQDDLLTRKDGSREEFFDTAEQQVIDALRAYAEQADADSYQRRLFADDAARGFAFIDLCRKRYDAVVMNPPFGEFTGTIGPYVSKQYPLTKTNIYCTFVERACDVAPEGIVGLISARTFVVYRDFEKFRRSILIDSATICGFADLGWEVLDGAQVETAAYVLRTRKTAANQRSETVGPFIRLLKESVDDKGQALLQAIRSDEPSKETYWVTRDQLTSLPGSPLAYWASPYLVRQFSLSPTFEPELAYCGRGAAVHVFFFRLGWELPLTNNTTGRWTRLAHGGEYSPFYRENSVFIDWEDDGRKPKQYILKKYPYLNGNIGWAIQDEDKYGIVGLTSGKRNERFNVQLMPTGHIFTNEGQGFTPYKVEDVWFSLGYLNSSLVSYFLALTSGLQKTWIYIRPIPVLPVLQENKLRISDLARESFSVKRHWNTGAEESAWFVQPWRVTSKSDSLREVCANILREHQDDSERLDRNRTEISDLVIGAAQLGAQDKHDVAEDFQRHPGDVAFSGWRNISDGDLIQLYSQAILSYLLGTAFGRWDIRYATGERKPPELPDPFEPLPVCPPGMLQNAEGLPAEPKDVPADYPLRISWPGILVDDENHPEDIVARVREAIEVIWKDRAEAIEQEACGILGVKTLREYFRRPAAFFADHLKRYSKSRRQAPIYWPLSTKSGSYTLWLYYHRLTDQTLHTCLADFLDPKIRKVQSELDSLTGSGGGGTRAGELREFLDELHDLRDEIERVIKLPWKPNLNDGVLITASPLHKLFRLPKWQKDLKACWDKLAKGEYDWAHLAHTIWPSRVEKACEKDRSIAIAHGLEQLCKVEPPKPKRKRGKKDAEEDSEEDEPQLIEEV
jgi:hypothetical protein